MTNTSCGLCRTVSSGLCRNVSSGLCRNVSSGLCQTVSSGLCQTVSSGKSMMEIRGIRRNSPESAGLRWTKHANLALVTLKKSR
jgi:hypothetical protein